MKILFLALSLIMSISVYSAPKKVLVILSSENKITLKEGKVHPTGFFLSELMVPMKSIIEAGYEPVIATPSGKKPYMDKVSDSASWFDGDEKKYQEAKALLKSLRYLSDPLSLEKVRKGNLSQFSGFFVPGGHAPMEDLLINPDLGEIFKYFHQEKKPTGLICHGPIALLSSLPRASEFTYSLAQGKKPVNSKWIYEGYKMTSFNTDEEKQEEPGQDNALGGYVKFYPNEALKLAGGVITVGDKWKSHVIRDRELITAQNPMSDKEFAKVFLEALKEEK